MGAEPDDDDDDLLVDDRCACGWVGVLLVYAGFIDAGQLSTRELVRRMCRPRLPFCSMRSPLLRSLVVFLFRSRLSRGF